MHGQYSCSTHETASLLNCGRAYCYYHRHSNIGFAYCYTLILNSKVLEYFHEMYKIIKNITNILGVVTRKNLNRILKSHRIIKFHVFYIC
jgi:hypothetical protein